MTALRRATGNGIFDQSISIAPECPVLVITGPNESGKTSRLHLPELVVGPVSGGNYPLLGKSPSRFSSDALYDDGMLITRETDRKGKPVLTLDGVSSADDGETLKTIQAMIDDRLGAAHGWSIGDLMALTPAKRLKWLEDRILESVDGDLTGSVAPFAKRVVHLCTYDELPSPLSQADLVAMLADIREADKEAHSEALRLGRVVKQEQIGARSDNFPGGTVDGWRAKAEEYQTQITALERQQQGIETSRTARAALQSEIEGKTKTAADALKIDVDAIRAQNADAIAKAAELVEKHAQVVTQTRETEAEAHDRIEPLETAEREARDILVQVQTAHDGLADRLGKMTESEGQCSICGSSISADDVQAVREELTRLAAKLLAAENAASGALGLVASARRQHTKTERAVNAAKDAVRDAEEALRVTERDAKDAEASAQKQIEDGTAAHDDLEQLRAKLDALPADLANEAIDEQITALKTSKSEAVTSADALSDSMQTIAAREEHRTQLSDAKDRRDEARDLIAELGPNGLLGRILSGAFGPLVETVNKYLEPVTGSKLWVETEGGFTWGYERDYKRVPIETASRSHRAIAMLLFAGVVRSKLGGWRFVTIDDCENLEAARRTALVTQLIRMCDDGLLDQAWVAAVSDNWTPPEGVHHIQIGK